MAGPPGNCPLYPLAKCVGFACLFVFDTIVKEAEKSIFVCLLILFLVMHIANLNKAGVYVIIRNWEKWMFSRQLTAMFIATWTQLVVP